MKIDKEELLEILSDLEHEQWISWVEYIIDAYELDDGSLSIPKEKVNKWLKLMNTSYEELTEEEKDEDREFGQKVLDVVLDYIGD